MTPFISRYNADLAAIAKINSVHHMECGARTLFFPFFSLNPPKNINININKYIKQTSRGIVETIVIWKKKKRQPAFNPSGIHQWQMEGWQKHLFLSLHPCLLIFWLSIGGDETSCVHFTYWVHSGYLTVNRCSLTSRGKSGEGAVTRFNFF